MKKGEYNRMTLTVAEFKEAYKKKFEDMYAIQYKNGSPIEQFQALGTLLRSLYTDQWVNYNHEMMESQQKQVYYFSMEFLPGRQLKRYLLNMDLLDTARTALTEMGLDFEAIACAEVDPALGNGGLGRLASCFMDSMASTGVPGNGTGISTITRPNSSIRYSENSRAISGSTVRMMAARITPSCEPMPPSTTMARIRADSMKVKDSGLTSP